MVELEKKSVIIFDLDGTLAPSKGSIDDEMHNLLQELLKKKKVIVMSGGKFRQFKEQLLDKLTLSEESLANLFLSPGGGSSMYRFEDGEIHEMYAEYLTTEEKVKIKEAFDYALSSSGVEIPEKHYGEELEDRGTEMTFSALGQEAPLEIKSVWDPDHEKREKIVEKLREKIPEFDITIGGTTSIDITHKGIDKAYGVREANARLNIPIADLVYVGDALFPGGNDEKAKESGVETVAVSDVEETKELIRGIINT